MRLLLFSSSEEQAEEESTSEETKEEEDIPQQNLPVLQPGDNLLITEPPSHQKLENGDSLDASNFENPDAQKRNVLNKITDRGKDIISILYPPFEEERNEQKFDDSERKKAEKYAKSTDQILRVDSFQIPRSSKVSQPTPLAQVIEGRVITAETKSAEEPLEGNSKLWIGKDYTNFIVKDFNNLDLPFVGT